MPQSSVKREPAHKTAAFLRCDAHTVDVSSPLMASLVRSYIEAKTPASEFKPPESTPLASTDSLASAPAQFAPQLR